MCNPSVETYSEDIEMKRKPPRQVSKSSFSLLSNPLVRQFLKDSDIHAHARKFLFHYKGNDFEERLSKFLAEQSFRSTFNAYGKTVEALGSKIRLPDNLPFQRTLSIYRVIFKDQAYSLATFKMHSQQFERSFLLGDYSLADEQLEKIRDDLGESLWYIRQKILIMVYRQRLDDLAEFCEQMKRRQQNKLISYMIERLYVFSQKTQAAKHLQNLLVSDVKELREAGCRPFADFLAFTFAPDPLFQRTDYRFCLPCFSLLSLVDQYAAMVDLLPRILTEEGEFEASNEEKKAAAEFLSDVDDAVSQRVLESYPNLEKASSSSTLEYSLLKAYDQGHYASVFEMFTSRASELDNPIAFVNIVAKCLSYEPATNQLLPGPLGELATQLSSLYSLSESLTSVYDEIQATAIRCRGLIRQIDIQLMVYKAIPFRFYEKDLKYAARLALREGVSVSPLVHRMANSVNLIDRHHMADDHDYSLIDYRAQKREIARLAVVGAPNHQILDELRKLAEITPLQKDYIEFQSEYLVSRNEAQLLISLAAETMAREPNSFICFPIESLIREIETERLATIEAVIVCYFYSRFLSPKKDYVFHEAFEDFILSCDVEKPTELFNKQLLSESYYKLFFEKICTTDVMDFLSCFRSSNDLRAERVAILDHLRETGYSDAAEQSRELTDLLGQIIIEASTTEINSNKIFVDTNAIRASALEEVDSLLSIYKISDEAKGEKFVRAPSISDEEKKVVAGDRNTVLLKIISLIRKKFLTDDKHGLDKNLSAEIRHGFFENLMRSRLEKAHLLTEKGEHGYLTNTFWRDKNVFLQKRVLNEIDEHLKWFTASFNGLIDAAEHWMQISTQTSGDKLSGPAFEFSLNVGEFEDVKNFVNASTNASAVIDFITDILWGRTETCLKIMRERLNNVFGLKVDDLFEELLNRITHSKGNAAALELTNAIVQVRSEIREDIATVVSWFKRNVNPYFTEHSLKALLDIAVTCFRTVKTFTNHIEVNLPIEFIRQKIPGSGLKPFVIAVMNLLDNCFKRSGFGAETFVRIDGTVHAKSLKICLSNPLSEARAKVLTSDVISDIRARMSSPESMNLMRIEGGSGIGKAFNHFRIASSRLSLSVDNRNGRFCADISYDI